MLHGLPDYIDLKRILCICFAYKLFLNFIVTLNVYYIYGKITIFILFLFEEEFEIEHLFEIGMLTLMCSAGYMMIVNTSTR